MIIKAEKSHSLPSASWRPRKAGGIVLVQVEGPENWGTNDVTPSIRAGEDQCQNSSSQRAQILLSSAFLFFSGPQQIE